MQVTPPVLFPFQHDT